MATLTGVSRAVVFYDEDCGFCRWALAHFLRWDRARRLRPVPLRSPEADVQFSGIDDETRMASWHLLAVGGTLASAGAVLAPLLELLPGGSPLAGLARRFPGITARGYCWIADHRTGLAKPLTHRAVERATARIAAHAR